VHAAEIVEGFPPVRADSDALDAGMRAWLRASGKAHPCPGPCRAWAALRHDEHRVGQYAENAESRTVGARSDCDAALRTNVGRNGNVAVRRWASGAALE
jgi:hypothetical protein